MKTNRILIPWKGINLYELHSNPEKLVGYSDNTHVVVVPSQAIIDDVVWLYNEWIEEYSEDIDFADYVFESFNDISLPYEVESYLNDQSIEDRWDDINEVGAFVKEFKENNWLGKPTFKGYNKWSRGSLIT